MPFYKVPFKDVETGAVADTYMTVCSIIVADTAGHRCRLRSLQVGPSAATPTDLNVDIVVGRIADVSAGAAGTPGDTVSAANTPKVDPGSVASLMTSGRDYSVEPTAYETEYLWEVGVNSRGLFIKEWAAIDAIVATQDMLLGILAAPRAATLVAITGSIEYEVF